MTALCSAIFPCSALHAILDSLHLALVPTELKAVIQTQLPQKTSAHWASKRAASPLTFRSYKAVWQHLPPPPPAICARDGPDGKGILYAEGFINMRIHVCWLVTNQSASAAVNWVVKDKPSIFKCCSSCWSLGFFFLNFHWIRGQHILLTHCISRDKTPPPFRNFADSLEQGRRTVQAQEEAVETAKLRVERLIECFCFAQYT